MRIILLLITVFVAGMCNAQNFEGEIIYQTSYTSNIPDVTSEQFLAMMGNTQSYYIKGNKYKTVTNGLVLLWQLYVPTENRLYNKFAMSDTLLWSDGSRDTDPVIDFELKKGQGEILGYTCDVLIVKTQMKNVTYYFSTEIKVDASLYKDHQYGHWAFFMEKANSLPLKIEMETPEFSSVSLATEVRERALDDELFVLPDAPSIESPF